MHHLALVEVPEDFINGTASTSLSVWLDELLEPYAFDSASATVEHAYSCCSDPACEDCHGTDLITETWNPKGVYDWYCCGGRWGDLLYPRTHTFRTFNQGDNPWHYLVDGARLTKILREYLRGSSLLGVFSEEGFTDVDLSKETLTGAYYVLLDCHS